MSSGLAILPVVLLAFPWRRRASKPRPGRGRGSSLLPEAQRLELFTLLTSLKDAAVANIQETGSSSTLPPESCIACSESGVRLIYTIELDDETYVHHLSGARIEGSTPEDFGHALLSFATAVLCLESRFIEVAASPTGIVHAEARLSESEHQGFVSLGSPTRFRPVSEPTTSGLFEGKPDLAALTECEEQLLRYISSVEGSMEWKGELLRWLRVYDEYSRVHGSYTELAEQGNLEALKRALFLQWVSLAQPACLSGLGGVEDDCEQRVLELVDARVRNGNIDPELNFMLPHYHGVAGYYLDRSPDLTALRAVSSQERPWPPRVRPDSLAGRGQMGRYWSGVVEDR